MASLQEQVAAMLATPPKTPAPPSSSLPGDPLTDLSMDSLRSVVESNHTKVTDLFRAWDEDHNGKVSKMEFRKAIVALGFEATKEQTFALFDELDVDSNGSIEYKELHAALKGNNVRRAGHGQTCRCSSK